MNLDEYISERSDKIEAALNNEVPDEPEAIYGMLKEYLSRGGKRIRPILTLASATTAGGTEEDAFPYAIAIEIFHNFTLIHDDIEDNSPLRRGKPTLHEKFGIPIAINAGDALYTIVWSSLLSKNIPAEKFKEAVDILVKGFTSVVAGQGAELDWYRTQNFDLTEEDYFRMAGGKTASLMGASCKIGAFASDAPKEVQDAMEIFGNKVGLSFQIRDDVLNLVADPSKYKKEIGEDIKEGKRSLITLKLIQLLDGEEKERVIDILKRSKKTDEEVSWVIQKAQETGAIDYANSVSDKLVEDAKKELDVIKDEKKRQLLYDLADYMVRREK